MMHKFNKVTSIRKGLICPKIIFSAVGSLLLGNSCLQQGKVNYGSFISSVESNKVPGKEVVLLNEIKPISDNPLKDMVLCNVSYLHNGQIGLIQFTKGESKVGLLFDVPKDKDLNNCSTIKLSDQWEVTLSYKDGSIKQCNQFIKVHGEVLDKFSKQATPSDALLDVNNNILQAIISGMMSCTDYGIDPSTKFTKEVSEQGLTLKGNVNPDKLKAAEAVRFVFVTSSHLLNCIKSMLENPVQCTNKEVKLREYMICPASVVQNSLVSNVKDCNVQLANYGTAYLYVKEGNHYSLIKLSNVQSVKKSNNATCLWRRSLSLTQENVVLKDNTGNEGNTDGISEGGTLTGDEKQTISIGSNEDPVVTAVDSSNSKQNPKSENSVNNEPGATSRADSVAQLPVQGLLVCQSDHNPMDVSPSQQGGGNIGGNNTSTVKGMLQAPPPSSSVPPPPPPSGSGTMQFVNGSTPTMNGIPQLIVPPLPPPSVKGMPQAPPPPSPLPPPVEGVQDSIVPNENAQPGQESGDPGADLLAQIRRSLKLKPIADKNDKLMPNPSGSATTSSNGTPDLKRMMQRAAEKMLPGAIEKELQRAIKTRKKAMRGDGDSSSESDEWGD